MAKSDREWLIPGYDPDRDSDGYYYDSDAGELAVEFHAEMLRHVKGRLAGEPFILRPEQSDVVRAIFGWKNESDHLRRYLEVLIYQPRKNGKSTAAAGIGLSIFYLDDEPGAELYSGAAEKEQAKIIWNIARSMIQEEPDLYNRTQLWQNSIELTDSASTWKALSAEAYSKHGMNTHFFSCDEIHAHRSEELMDVMQTSMGAREQPLLLATTTADYDRESICNEKRDYAVHVRDGIRRDPRFLPIIYEATSEDDWKDPELHRRVNPGWGTSLRPDYFTAEFEKAKRNPRYENTFKRLHLNLRTEQAVRWLPVERWDALEIRKEKPPATQKTRCFAGLDLANTTDLNALVLFFPEYDGYMMSEFWVPQEHPEVIGKYAPWIRDGWMKTTPGAVTDYEFIRARLNEIGKMWNLDLGVDPYNATQFAVQLSEQDGLNVSLFRQGFSTMNEPTKRLEGLVLGKNLVLDGNPVLRWNLSNAIVRTDASNYIKLDKQRSSHKIDGMVAAVMAVGRWMAAGDSSESVYENRGITVIG